MDEQEAEQSRLRWVLLAMLLLGAVSLLGAENFSSQLGVLLHSLVRDTGIALIIASVVAFAFEKYMRERLYQQMGSRIADILNGFRLEAMDASRLQRLPAPLLEMVRSDIVEEPIIQRGVVLDYALTEFKPSGAADILLRSVLTTSYTLENLTGD